MPSGGAAWRRRSTKASPRCEAKSRSNRTSKTDPIPASRSSTASLWGVFVKRRGEFSGASTSTGWGSKVTTTADPPSRAADSCAASITALWPRCTPSKTPIARWRGPVRSLSPAMSVSTCIVHAPVDTPPRRTQAPRRRETSGRESIFAITSRESPCFSSSKVTERVRSNFPERVRRNDFR